MLREVGKERGSCLHLSLLPATQCLRLSSWDEAPGASSWSLHSGLVLPSLPSSTRRTVDALGSHPRSWGGLDRIAGRSQRQYSGSPFFPTLAGKAAAICEWTYSGCHPKGATDLTATKQSYWLTGNFGQLSVHGDIVLQVSKGLPVGGEPLSSIKSEDWQRKGKYFVALWTSWTMLTKILFPFV